MKSKTLEAIEREYDEKYGDLPLDRELLLKHLESTLKLDMNVVHTEADNIRNIPWIEERFVLPVIPKPSPRPRYSFKTEHFYVIGASVNKRLMAKYLQDQKIIFTRVHFHLETYQPTPKSQMSKTEIYLSEMGLIEPMQNPDWDNLGKTYSDMIQGLLLLNDNIITKGDVEKFYSIKPRVEMVIRYQADFDCAYNRKRITKSKNYLQAIECPQFEDYTIKVG